MLPARHRLRRSSEFTTVVRGARSGNRTLVAHATRADIRAEMPPRVGFVVSRAVGNAVVRNRTKRRLRALVTSRLASLPAGMDLVIRANPAAAPASYTALGDALDAALDRVIDRVGVGGTPSRRDAGPLVTGSGDARTATDGTDLLIGEAYSSAGGHEPEAQRDG